MASEVSSLVKSKVMKMMITEIKIIVIMMIKMTTVKNIIVIMLMLTAVGRQAGDQVSRSTDSWNLKNVKIIIKQQRGRQH